MNERLSEDYDAVAGAYANALLHELDGKPYDREALTELAASTRGPVADLGCGPGHVSGFLRDRGADVRGYDLSPGMVVEARRRFPDVRFEVADFTTLPAEAGSFAAVVAFYAIVHLPADELGPAFREWHRVLRDEGRLLMAFHVGRDIVEPGELFEIPVDLSFVFHDVRVVEEALESVGFGSVVSHVREPYPDAEHPSRRAYVSARR